MVESSTAGSDAPTKCQEQLGWLSRRCHQKIAASVRKAMVHVRRGDATTSAVAADAAEWVIDASVFTATLKKGKKTRRKASSMAFPAAATGGPAPGRTKTPIDASNSAPHVPHVSNSGGGNPASSSFDATAVAVAVNAEVEEVGEEEEEEEEEEEDGEDDDGEERGSDDDDDDERGGGGEGGGYGVVTVPGSLAAAVGAQLARGAVPMDLDALVRLGASMRDDDAYDVYGEEDEEEEEEDDA